ncbi:MAG: DedA family protein [Phycisphaera sp.]|nr:DedA family protein [Phycisphaera sp.]
MADVIQQFLGDYGWLAMIALLLASGIGIPIGEELVNVPAGVFVGNGEMAVIPTFIAAYVGVLGGDFLWFSICRFFGRGLLKLRWFRRFVHPRRLLQAKHQFDRRGAGVLVLARFIPGTRSPALTIAALMRMPWRQFTVVEIVCCAVTTPLQVGIGILIGRGLAGQTLQTTIFTALGIIAGIVALTGLVNWVIANRRRGEGPLPRARAEWLRQHRTDVRSDVGPRRDSCVRS